MAPLPTGNVTFLFTDIVGSARMWEQDAPAMDAALQRHNALLRDTIQRRGGHVFKLMGDSVCAVFRHPVKAAQAALEIQQGLQQEDWGSLGTLRVRQALHTGVAEEREGDYVGPSLNRVARLLGTGRGSQILMTATTREFLAGHLFRSQEEWSLRDLGLRRLRDLAGLEHVYQLLHPSLPDESQPLHSLANLPNNLPREVSSFIGREEPLREVVALLKQHRLVTLTGTGGAGKTRLSQRAAAERLPELADGVWLAELAALSDGERLAGAVCAQLGLAVDAHQQPLAVLEEHAFHRQMLLILDNCEHLLEPAARLSEHLLRHCPRLTVLATSRTALGLRGEIIYTVPPLQTPGELSEGVSEAELSALAEVEAVRLFIDRAQAALTGFSLTAQNAPDVAQICRRLDGIPLAIELAAVRIKVLSPEQIAARLNDRFRLLTGGGTTAPPHQQTLRATLDWSYDLLTPEERATFRRMGVFAGGWSLEAAESVAAVEGMDAYDVLEYLSHLVDRSLVLCEATTAPDDVIAEDQRRYRMLETLHQYAQERLAELPEEERSVRERHLECFAALAVQAEPLLEGAESSLWLTRLQQELPNFRAALAWPDGGEKRLQLAVSLWRYWYRRGPAAEGRDWLEKALAQCPDAPHALRARAHSAVGNLANQQGDYAEARRHHEAALAIRREGGDPVQIGGSLNNLGIAALNEGCHADALRYLEEALALARAHGNEWRVASSLANLGTVSKAMGDHAAGRAWLEEARDLYRRLDARWPLGITLNNLGHTVLEQGCHAEAVDLLREALRMFQGLQTQSDCILILGGFAKAAYGLGDSVAAARLLGAEQHARARLRIPTPQGEEGERDRFHAALAANLGPEPLATELALGQALTLEAALEYVLAWTPPAVAAPTAPGPEGEPASSE